MFCPAQTEAARKNLEKKAKEKLLADVREKGFEPLVDTFRAEWQDPGFGLAYVVASSGL